MMISLNSVKKKIISLLIVFASIISLTPVNVFAGTHQLNGNCYYSGKIKNGAYLVNVSETKSAINYRAWNRVDRVTRTSKKYCPFKITFYDKNNRYITSKKFNSGFLGSWTYVSLKKVYSYEIDLDLSNFTNPCQEYVQSICWGTIKVK